ncbi:DUF998 domain-containing protein [Streptomyces sp. NPDC050704]|uniref:DUF998 domain-containing protein n=1 Tax=Streptomyces sp. NPDC050704 TaxID=3157219 RepID=UPI0034352D5A
MTSVATCRSRGLFTVGATFKELSSVARRGRTRLTRRYLSATPASRASHSSLNRENRHPERSCEGFPTGQRLPTCFTEASYAEWQAPHKAPVAWRACRSFSYRRRRRPPLITMPCGGGVGWVALLAGLLRSRLPVGAAAPAALSVGCAGLVLSAVFPTDPVDGVPSPGGPVHRYAAGASPAALPAAGPRGGGPHGAAPRPGGPGTGWAWQAGRSSPATTSTVR